jgi:hypothetical protein
MDGDTADQDSDHDPRLSPGLPSAGVVHTRPSPFNSATNRMILSPIDGVEDRQNSLWRMPEREALLGPRRERTGQRRWNQPFEFEALEPRILLSAAAAAVPFVEAAAGKDATRIEQPEAVMVAAGEGATGDQNGALGGAGGASENGSSTDFEHHPKSSLGSLFDVPADEHFVTAQATPAGTVVAAVDVLEAVPGVLEGVDQRDILADDGDESGATAPVGAAADGVSPVDQIPQVDPVNAGEPIVAGAASDQFDATEDEGVLVVGGSISANTTWSGTIHVTGDVTVQPGVVLTLQPGAVIKFGQGRYLLARGSLMADGDSASPITFTSVNDDSVGVDVSGAGASTPSRGEWNGVYFDGGSDASVLDEVVLKYAGSDANWGALNVRGSSPMIEDALISEVAGRGVVISAGAPTMTRVAVTNAGGVAFDAGLATGGQFVALSASATGGNYFRLPGGDVAGGVGDNRVWNYGGLPLHLSAGVRVFNSASLTIAAGQIVKMNSTAISVFNSSGAGRLIVEGTPQAPVVFTSLFDDSAGGDSNGDGSATTPARGQWGGIFIASGDGTLANFEVRYAGSDANSGGVSLNGGTPTLINATIRESGSYGVRITGGAPALNGVRVDGSTNVAFFLRLERPWYL